MTLKLVTDPDAFFHQKIKDPSLWKPLLIVLLAGMPALVSSLLTFQKMMGGLPEGTQTFVAVGAVFGGVIGLIATVVVWVVFAAVFYLISMVFDGEGDFLDTLKLTGWGFIPSLIGGVIGVAAIYVALQGVQPPQNPEAMAAFSRQLQNNPTLRLSSALGILFTLWSWLLWTFAIKHARNLQLKQAAITTSVPVAVSILWTAINLFIL